MSRWVVGCLALSVISSPRPSSAGSADDLSARLGAAFERRLAEPGYASTHVGIRVVALDDGAVLFERESERGFIPASAAKIFPAAVSLAKLGAEHRFATPIMTDGAVDDGVLTGDLYLVGRGDPGLTVEHLDAASRALAAAGIRRVTGDLVYDTSLMDDEGTRYPPNARHLYAPPSALTVNWNWIVLELDVGPPARLSLSPPTAYAKLSHSIEVVRSSKPGKPAMTYVEKPWGDSYTVAGTVTDWDRRYDYLRVLVSRPGLYASTLFKESLVRAGIVIDGALRHGVVPSTARQLHAIATPPLVDSVRVLAQESNNVVAELVNKLIGARVEGPPGTRAKGLAGMARVLVDDVGLDAGSFRIADASGLSPDNRFSPRQFTAALRHFHASVGEPFVASLAPQGKHPHAMNPSPPPHVRMFSKSGTLPSTGVNTSVGYVFLDRTGDGYAYAVLVNRRGNGAPAYSGTWTNPILSTMVDVLATVGDAP